MSPEPDAAGGEASGQLVLWLAATSLVLALSAALPVGVPGRSGVLLVAGLGVGCRPRLLHHPGIWFGLAAGFAMVVALAPDNAGNHHFLAGYLGLATGLVVGGQGAGWQAQWACNARWLLVGVMGFATLQKLLSPEYLRGEFWAYFLSLGMAGKLVFATGLWDGAVEVFRENRNGLAVFVAGDPAVGGEVVLAEPFPYFRTVVMGLTWVVVVIEAMIAVAFASGRAGARWPHYLLIGFVGALILVRPEVEFAAILLALGAIVAVHGRAPSALHWVYAAGIGLCGLLSLLLQGRELGVPL